MCLIRCTAWCMEENKLNKKRSDSVSGAGGRTILEFVFALNISAVCLSFVHIDAAIYFTHGQEDKQTTNVWGGGGEGGRIYIQPQNMCRSFSLLDDWWASFGLPFLWQRTSKRACKCAAVDRQSVALFHVVVLDTWRLHIVMCSVSCSERAQHQPEEKQWEEAVRTAEISS